VRRALWRIAWAGPLLLVIAYVIWDQIEARGLRRDIAAIAARGEPIATDDPEAAELTAEQRDAARIYATAAERVQDVARQDASRHLRLDVDNPAGQPGTLDELEARYRADAAALQLLDRATPLDFRAFGDVAPDLYTNQEPLASLNSLNALRADLLSMRGRGDDAAGVLVASVRLLRTIPLSYYRGNASRRLLGSVRILLRNASPGPGSLAKLQQAFESLPDTDTLTHEMLQARAEFIEVTTHPSSTIGQAVTARLMRPLNTRGARQQLAAYDETIALTRLSWPQRVEQAAIMERRFAEDFKASREGRFRGWWFARRWGPAFGGMPLFQAAYDLSGRRVAIAALAVERYRRANGGAVPVSLETLVPTYLPAVPDDPFSGKPLIYTRTPAEYRIYSVDNNRTDDGGVFYGIGSRGQSAPRAGAPRDFGIQVPVTNLTTRHIEGR
jgi:hypothetical protein